MSSDEVKKLINKLRKVQDITRSSVQKIQFRDYPINGALSFINYSEDAIKIIVKKKSRKAEQILNLLIDISLVQLEFLNSPGSSSHNLKLWEKFMELMTAKNHSLLIKNLGTSYLNWAGQLGALVNTIVCHKRGWGRTMLHLVWPPTRTRDFAQIMEHMGEEHFKLGLRNVNLIGRPMETFQSWVSSVNKTITVCPRINHIELYVEQGITKMRLNPEIVKQPFPLKTRVFHTRGKESPQNSIIFHVQGGGFQSLIEGSYAPLLRYCTKLLNIPSICVDYRVCPEDFHPAYLQDILDAYYFFTSGTPEVKQMLGFFPENIIITGDSAGGNIAIMLAKAVSMINQQFNLNIMMPTCLSLMYPATFGVPSMDSMVFSLIDTYAPFSPFLSCAVDAMGFDGFQAGWHRRIDELSEFIDRMEATVLKDPIRYWTFEGGLDFLKGIKLSVICGEYDPLLDNSISLTKYYPADSLHAFDIPPKCTHAFTLELFIFCPINTKMIPFRIAEMMGLPFDQMHPKLYAQCMDKVNQQKARFSEIRKRNLQGPSPPLAGG